MDFVEELKDAPLVNKKESFEWIKAQGDFKVSKIEFKGIMQGMDTISVLEIR